MDSIGKRLSMTNSLQGLTYSSEDSSFSNMAEKIEIYLVAGGRSSYSSGKGRSNQGPFKYGFSLIKVKTNHQMEDFHVAKFVRVRGHELGLFAIFHGHLRDSVPAFLHILTEDLTVKWRTLPRNSGVATPCSMMLMFVSSFHILSDFIHVICSEYVEEKKELIQALLRDRKSSNLPRITQAPLVLWGRTRPGVPPGIGIQIERLIGVGAELVVIKNAGHAVNLENPREFIKQLKLFLLH